MNDSERLELLVDALLRFDKTLDSLSPEQRALIASLNATEDFPGYVESDLPADQAAYLLLHSQSARQKCAVSELLAIVHRIRGDGYSGRFAEAMSLLDTIKLEHSLSEDFDFDWLYDPSVSEAAIKDALERHRR